jgi:chitinase
MLNSISIYRHPRDTDNFLALIKLLRQMLKEKYPEEHKLLTAAVSANVFKDEDRHNVERLEEGWAKDMDAFYIMVYIDNLLAQNILLIKKLL